MTLAPLRTDSVFEKSVNARPGGTLELDLDTGGDLEIIGTDDQKVSVHGTLGGNDWRSTSVDLEEHNGNARLVSRYEKNFGSASFDNAFTIRVPKRFNVRVKSAGGDLRITNLDGTFDGFTGGGRIALEHTNGEAHLSTGGGDVHVTKSKLDGSVTTGGGRVHFDEVTGDISGSSGSDPMRMGATFYRAPMLKGLESLQRIPEIDEETMESTRQAMKASEDAMRGSQEAMRRAQEVMRDSMRTMDRTMERAMARAQIKMERKRRSMGDSAKVRMREYRWKMDTTDDEMDNNNEIDNNDESSDSSNDDSDNDDGRVNRKKEIIRYRLPGDHHSETISRNGFIVIDKDGGSIELQDAPKGAHVTTGGGAIIIGKSRGDVSAMTGGGDIDLGPMDGAADATTGAGDVSINLVGERPHPVNIRSGKGNVELVLPPDANATLDLETAYTENYRRHTKITGDWPLNVTETDQWDDSHGTPRKYVRVRQEIGKGGPVIRVRTVNGDIRVKRGS
jgi:hypothetical protein